MKSRSNDPAVTDHKAITRRIAALDTESDVEQAIELLNSVQLATRQLKDLNTQATAALVEWMESNGDITVGEVRYYPGTYRTYVPLDKYAIADHLLVVLEGDLRKFVETFASRPFKPSEVRTLLGEVQFRKLYELRESRDVKTGKPVKKVIRAQE
jgi:hypothetical protein